MRTRDSLCDSADSVRYSWSACSAVCVSGCRQDMHDQPKYIPLRASTFFDDERSARPLVAGTVARGQLHEDALLYTGKVNGADATIFPFPIDERAHGARSGAVRHLLLAVPRAHRPGRRHGRAPRLPASAVVSRRSPAERARRTFLRRHDQRLRRDARLRRADQGGGSLGHHRLHPRPAAQRARDRSTTCRPDERGKLQ